MPEPDLTDFDGCSARSCRPRSKAPLHTFEWGLCAHAPESARPEPVVTLLGVYTAADGEKSVGATSFTVTEMASKVEEALRTVSLSGWIKGVSGDEYGAMALAVAQMLAGGR